MVEHGLPRGNHRDQIVRADFVRAQPDQDWRIEVGECLAGLDERVSFRFKQPGVLPGINQPGGGGEQQFKTRMRIHVAQGDPGGLRRQGNGLIGQVAEAVRALVIVQKFFLHCINHEQIAAAVPFNIGKKRLTGVGRECDRLA